jgi:hypothetical protein
MIRTMHSTLLSTSTHALAAQHLKRMESFPIPNTGIPPPSVADAQSRLRAAELDLGEKMRELHDTFDELMKRTLVQSRPRDRDTYQEKEKGKDDAGLSRAEIEEVRNRMKVLERRMDDVPPPPPPAVSPPPPPPSVSRKGKEKEEPTTKGEVGEAEGEEPSGKRSRARILLEDMLSRLQAVETLKEDLETRCGDLEDLVNAKVQDEMEIVRVGNGRWKVVEDLRDVDGVIRGLKRKRKDSEHEDRGEGGRAPPPGDIPPPPLDSATSTPGTDPAITKLQEQVAFMEKDRLEIASLKAEVESLKSKSKSNTNTINPVPPVGPDPTSTIKLLIKNIDSLQTELKTLKAERQAWEQKMKDEREQRDKDTLVMLKQHCEDLVKTVSWPELSSQMALLIS